MQTSKPTKPIKSSRAAAILREIRAIDRIIVTKAYNDKRKLERIKEKLQLVLVYCEELDSPLKEGGIQ